MENNLVCKPTVAATLELLLQRRRRPTGRTRSLTQLAAESAKEYTVERPPPGDHPMDPFRMKLHALLEARDPRTLRLHRGGQVRKGLAHLSESGLDTTDVFGHRPSLHRNEGVGRNCADADASVAIGNCSLRRCRLAQDRGRAHGLNCVGGRGWSRAKRHPLPSLPGQCSPAKHRLVLVQHSEPVACARRKWLGPLLAQPRVREGGTRAHSSRYAHSCAPLFCSVREVRCANAGVSRCE